MRRIGLVVLLLSLVAIIAVTANATPTGTSAVSAVTSPVLPPLYLGSYGPRVRDAKWLLKGNNRYAIHTYFRAIDNYYGPRMARASKRAKYLLGYPVWALDGRFGHQLWRYVTYRDPLPKAFVTRRHLRLNFNSYGGSVYLLGNCRYMPPKAYMLAYVKRVSTIYRHPLACVSGTRSGSIVLGTSHLSMHNWGYAADIYTPTLSMNLEVGRDALMACGMPRMQALSYYNFAGWYGHCNILFHTFIGGNHYAHVHAGIWPYDWARINGLPLPSRTSFRFANMSSVSSPGLAYAEGVSTGIGAWSFPYYKGMVVDTARKRAGLQAMKNELVYNGYGKGIVLDVAAFGDAMRNRVLDFQRANGIGADGTIGPTTSRYLLRARSFAIEMAQGMPDHLLARLKSLESANDPVAQGVTDSGDEGLVQLHMVYYPTITVAQAWDPAYILPWAGRRLTNFNQTTHDWDTTIVAWNLGLYYALQWKAAGKPSSGGPIIGGVDFWARATAYLKYVKSASY